MTKRRCVISSLKPFSNAFLGPSGQVNIRVFSQSGQSNFILIAIRAERLRRIQTKTTQRQPTFTFGKCEEMSLGMLITMNFQLFLLKSGFIHNQKGCARWAHYLEKSCVIFSSPEHNVLRGSYCDRSSSVVRPSVCPSINNFFKNLLLQNQKANLDKTWQECSLGEALQKLLKEFNSNKNSGCHGNKMAENGKNL